MDGVARALALTLGILTLAACGGSLPEAERDDAGLADAGGAELTKEAYAYVKDVV